MPKCGSQCYLCDLPIRFDTYSGCSHGCKYCFAEKFKDIKEIKTDESWKSLLNFIQGKRKGETKWCDWDIPIHIGGMSDPFQPIEAEKKATKKCLEVLRDYNYPFVISTKGRLVAEEEWLSILEKCNCVVQISLVCEQYDKLEEGCPSFKERLEIIKKISKRVKRVIVRIQPYMCECFKEIFENLSKFKEAGAYGVIIEGMKFSKKVKGMVKIGADFAYPYKTILVDFLKLRDEGHRLGLKVYAGENRIRKFGDSLTCCGVDGMEGFKPNVYNLNHWLNGDMKKPSENMIMNQVGTADCFHSGLMQTTIGVKKYNNQSFIFSMAELYKNQKERIDDVLGKSKK